MRKKINNNRILLINILFSLVVILCLTLTIGYSVYEANLFIDDSLVTIRVDKDVRITSIQVDDLVNGAVSNYTDYSIDEIYADIELPNSNSQLVYKVSLKNYGNVEMGVSDILINNEYNDILTIESVIIGDKIRNLDGSCENDVNGCKLNIDSEFLIVLKYIDGAYNASNTVFDNVTLNVMFNEAFDVTFEGFTNFTPSSKDLVALKNSSYTVNIGSLLLNERLVVKVNDQIIYNYTFENGTLVIPNVQGNINIGREFVDGVYYSISYQNIDSSNYPTSIKEGETLSITFTGTIPSSVHVNNASSFTYENGILTVPNVNSDITIVALDDVDLPIIMGDDNSAIIESPGISESAPIQVGELFNMTFAGQNINEVIINKIDVTFQYTATSGKSQSFNVTLVTGGQTYTQTVPINGKVTNEVVTVTFDNLSIGQYDTFEVKSVDSGNMNNKIQISKQTIQAYFAEI